jgi:hypothetical protein
MGYAPLSGSLVRTGVITVYGQYDSQNFNVMYRSEDMGQTWDSVKTPLKGGKGWIVLSADGKVMLHRPENATYRSDDNGATWTAVETGEQTNYSHIVADPVNPDVFYVMNSMGTLYKSTDAGKNFVKQDARLQNESAGEYYNGSNYIRTVPGREGHVWVPMDQAQVWLTKGFSENGLAYTEDGGKSWNRCEGASTAIAVGIGKAKEGADYETIFIWGAAKEGDPIGIYRSTDKCKTFERVNDDMHQFGGPGNGNFVQGDMNTFGVVYMSTVGRGLIVGAPEGTEFITRMRDVRNVAGVMNLSVQVHNRDLLVHTSVEGRVLLLGVNGKQVLAETVSGNARVSLTKVPAGAYVVKFLDGRGKVLLSKKVAVR